MRPVRTAWLIAATLLVARLGKSLLDVILWYVIRTGTLSLPRAPFYFVQYLNAAALVSVSFAIVATCDWLIERRFTKRHP
jgi:hypothetical protein